MMGDFSGYDELNEVGVGITADLFFYAYMFMFILILLNVFVAIVCYAYDQACEEAEENQIQDVDLRFVGGLIVPGKPSAKQCLAVLDMVCKVPPKKRRFSLSGAVPAKAKAGADVDEDGVAPLKMSEEELATAIAKAARTLKLDSRAVKALVLNERYLDLVTKGPSNDAEESANFRVALQAKVDGLEEDNKRLQENLAQVSQKLDLVLAKLSRVPDAVY